MVKKHYTDTVKVLFYLLSEKIWVGVLQNQCMFAKNYYLHWIAGRANILSNYIIYIFFGFGCGFYGSFPMLFPKAPACCCKTILNEFLLHFTSIFLSSKRVSQIFKIFFQVGDINIFVFHGVFFSRYVPLKSSFFDKKNGKI